MTVRCGEGMGRASRNIGSHVGSLVVISNAQLLGYDFWICWLFTLSTPTKLSVGGSTKDGAEALRSDGVFMISRVTTSGHSADDGIRPDTFHGERRSPPEDLLPSSQLQVSRHPRSVYRAPSVDIAVLPLP